MAMPTTDSFPLPEFSSEATLALTSPIELLEEDGVPLESEWHRWAMNILIDSVRQHLRTRDDFYVGGNAFIYYNEKQARNRDYRGPDFFFVWGRPRFPKRPYWAIWEENGKFPNVIIELMSPTTSRIDLGPKKDLYENTFRTEDYFCYDPDVRQLFGWTLTPVGYVELQPNDRGWLWSNELQLWLGAVRCVVSDDDDIYLRFFTPEGKLVGVFEDVALEAADAARRSAERSQAEAARAQAEAALAQADADRERRRAEAAETELAKLKAQLKAKDNPAS